MPDDEQDEIEEESGLVEEPKLWQVKFSSGQGQQYQAADEDEVREAMAKVYGADYEIDSITDITPQPVK